MEIGKMYKNKFNGAIVFCIEHTSCTNRFFKGVVIERGEGVRNVGDTPGKLYCKDFEKYTPTQILTNGHTYNIPDGCKATVKDGVITIEDDIKYYKTECSDYISYTRKCSEKCIGITIYEDGFASININDTFAVASTECSEKEFLDAYNKILKQVQL